MLAEESAHEARDLHRGLKDRHIQMIASAARSASACSLGRARDLGGRARPATELRGGRADHLLHHGALGELLLYRPVAACLHPTPEFIGPLLALPPAGRKMVHLGDHRHGGGSRSPRWRLCREPLVSGRAPVDTGARHACGAVSGQPDLGGAVRRAGVLVRIKVVTIVG